MTPEITVIYIHFIYAYIYIYYDVFNILFQEGEYIVCIPYIDSLMMPKCLHSVV